MRLTKEKAVEEHRKLWRWIAKTTQEKQACVSKQDYFRAVDGIEIPINYCFCCDYGLSELEARGETSYLTEDFCEFCPIDWRSIQPSIMCEFVYDDHKNLYNIWTQCYKDHDWVGASSIASLIAELPERIDNSNKDGVN